MQPYDSLEPALFNDSPQAKLDLYLLQLQFNPYQWGQLDVQSDKSIQILRRLEWKFALDGVLAIAHPQ